MSSNHVTHRHKCYVYQCAECGLLDIAERSDRLTCSVQCRVRAHRNGNLKLIRDLAASIPGGAVEPGLILQANAAKALLPDLTERVARGELTLDDIRSEIWDAFWARIEAVRLASEVGR